MKLDCLQALKRNWLFAFAAWWERTRALGRAGFSVVVVIPVYTGLMMLFWVMFNLNVVTWRPLRFAFDWRYFYVALLLYPLLGYILGNWVYWFCEKTHARVLVEPGDQDATRAAHWAEERKRGVLYHVVLRGMLRDGLIMALFFAGQPLPYVLNLYSYTVSVCSHVPGSLDMSGQSLEAWLFGPFLWYLVIPLGALIGASIYYWRYEIRYKAWSETRDAHL